MNSVDNEWILLFIVILISVWCVIDTVKEHLILKNKLKRKITLRFLNYKKEVLLSEINLEYFDIDFDGNMLVRFKNDTSKIIAVNGVNGYGENIKHEIIGIEAEILNN